MKPTARSIARDVLTRWENAPGHVYAEALIAEAASAGRLAANDRALVNALVLGVLRNRTLLDHWISRLLKSGRSQRIKPPIRNTLRCGLFQLLLQDAAPHAAVNEAVAQTTRAFRPLVNALLRRAGRERAALLDGVSQLEPGPRFSHPDFLVQRWERQFGGGATLALLEWDNRPAELFARKNPLAKSPISRGAPFPFPGSISERVPLIEKTEFYRWETLDPEAIADGGHYLQDPSTAIAPCLLNPKPGERVLDACAAPGGKTALLSALSRGEAEIVAVDSSDKRIARLEENIRRLKLPKCSTQIHDWTGDAAFETGRFDAILLDVPCSNSGVLRRRVDARWRMETTVFEEHATLQLALLDAILPSLKDGGRIIYSTCSIDPEENTGVVTRFLEKHPNFSLGHSAGSRPDRDGIDGAYAAYLVNQGK